MKRLMMGLTLFILIPVLAGAAFAGRVTVGTDGGLTVDGAVYQLISPAPAAPGPDVPQGTGLMWEWDGSSWKACLCQMVSFRALQAVEKYLDLSGLESSRTGIVTGWNTHGPEELYVDLMPWEENLNFQYADPITAGSSLSIDDAWFRFTIEGKGTYEVKSDAENYRFTHDKTHAGYHEDWGFFDYRTFVKGGQSGPEKFYFSQHIRSQIVDNLKGETVFQVSAVPVPGTAGLLISGLLGLAAVSRRSRA